LLLIRHLAVAVYAKWQILQSAYDEDDDDYIQGGPKKTWTVFRLDNIVTVSP